MNRFFIQPLFFYLVYLTGGFSFAGSHSFEENSFIGNLNDLPEEFLWLIQDSEKDVILEKALDIGASQGNLTMLKFAMDNGADLYNYETKDGLSLLHLAAKYGQGEVINWLLNLDQYSFQDLLNDDYINTPLHYAISCGNLSICEQLIKAGNSIDALGIRERTPLHIAVLGDNLDVIIWLIQEGANIDLRDEDDNTALDIAQAHLKGAQARLDTSSLQFYISIITILQQEKNKREKSASCGRVFKANDQLFSPTGKQEFMATPSPSPSNSIKCSFDKSGYFYNTNPSRPWYVEMGLISKAQDDQVDDNQSSNFYNNIKIITNTVSALLVHIMLKDKML